MHLPYGFPFLSTFGLNFLVLNFSTSSRNSSLSFFSEIFKNFASFGTSSSASAPEPCRQPTVQALHLHGCASLSTSLFSMSFVIIEYQGSSGSCPRGVC